MSIQTINIGNLVNDGLGDDLRTAFQKVNSNFSELNASLTVTASNLGSTGEGIFKQKTGSNLEFKSLVAGTKILLDGSDDSIIVNSTQPDAFVSVTTNSGPQIVAQAPNNLHLTLQGGENLRTSSSGTVVTIDSILNLNRILLNVDFGGVSGTYENAVQFLASMANVDFGTLTNPSNIFLDFGELT
jgi:hypothetical protein